MNRGVRLPAMNIHIDENNCLNVMLNIRILRRDLKTGTEDDLTRV